MDNPVFFIKQPITAYLQPRNLYDFMKSDTVCIDRVGNLYNLPLEAMNNLTEEEKLSFTNDYISFSYIEINRTIGIDISALVRPTTAQLDILKQCLEAIHHKNLKIHFAAWWNFPQGQKCSMWAHHRLPDIVMYNIYKAINEHKF